MSKPALIRLRGDFGFSGIILRLQRAQRILRKSTGFFVSVAPQMESVGENYVAHQIVLGNHC